MMQQMVPTTPAANGESWGKRTATHRTNSMMYFVHVFTLYHTTRNLRLHNFCAPISDSTCTAGCKVLSRTIDVLLMKIISWELQADNFACACLQELILLSRRPLERDLSLKVSVSHWLIPGYPFFLDHDVDCQWAWIPDLSCSMHSSNLKRNAWEESKHVVFFLPNLALSTKHYTPTR